MPLLDPAVALFCVNALSVMSSPSDQARYDQACNKATDAYTRQVGFKQDVDFLEDKSLKYVDEKAEKNFGKAGVYAVGASLFAYKAYRDKKVIFNIRSPGFCDTIENEASKDSYTMKFKWSFF